MYLDALAGLGLRLGTELQTILSQMRPMAEARVGPRALEAWDQEVATGRYRAFIDCWVQRDLGAFTAALGDFARAFAEARVPFSQFYEFWRCWDTCLLNFVVRSYGHHHEVKLLIETWELVDQIYTVVGAEAYAEVYAMTFNHLAQELTWHEEEPSHRLWPGVLKAARKLGLEPMLARFVAHQVVDAPDYPPGELTTVRGRVVHVGPHLCRADCGRTPEECLTALLVEAKVELRRRESMIITSLDFGPDGSCRVVLAPLLLRGPGP